jgi:hypothetical protein
MYEAQKAKKKLEKQIEDMKTIEKKAAIALDEIRENVSALFPTQRKELHKKVKDLERQEINLEIGKLALDKREHELEVQVMGKVNSIGNHVEELKNRLVSTERENKLLLTLVQRYAPPDKARQLLKDLKR